ncbi:MarR family winged helix-turn-helix transcriptional regulator [Desulfosediminicola flagellatus]|uniref:MarR family winged helix-turn-helix transcriptional regulator n=1 Tax=Desulfosediminicola flagellatus TaxID=2569541 RepID=UPI0010AC0EC3|nr:MarR family transcriptional regulator [Desulfosediminicola flagellatus]
MAKKQGKSLESTALSTFMKLLRCSESVANDVHRHLGNRGLTVSQYGILEALYHLGPLCQKDLAQKILKTAGNITTVICNLEKRGLVARNRVSDDRRFYSVALTEEGENLIKDLVPVHQHHIIERMSELTLEEQEHLGILLKKLSLGNTGTLITPSRRQGEKE